MRSVRKGGWERGRWLGVRGVRGVRERRWERGRWLGVRGVREGGGVVGGGGAGTLELLAAVYTQGRVSAHCIYTSVYNYYNITYRLLRVCMCGQERAGQLQKEEVVGEVRLPLWGCRLHSKQFYSCLKNSQHVYTSSAVFERRRVP